MTESVADPSRTPRWKGRKRLWFLLGGLIALLTVNVVFAFFPSFLGGLWGTRRPLDRCLTEQSVPAFLDGTSVLSIGSMNGAGKEVETIALRKEKISSLIIRSGDPPVILVQFNLDHEGKSYRVEGSFVFTSIDSPELHTHGWGQFIGQVVSNR